MTGFNQQRLLAEPDGSEVHLTTSGRTIRPYLEPITAIVDEAKIRATKDGIGVRAVDPTNVAVVDIDAAAGAFESFELDIDDVVVGVELGDLRRTLSDARMGKSTDDPVRLSLGDGAVAAEIERQYDATLVRRRSEFLTIDTDSIRQDPDVDSTDLELPWKATVDAAALDDAVDAVAGVTDHLKVYEDDGDLAMSGVGDDELEAERIAFDGVAEQIDEADGGEQSIFSIDYFSDAAEALRAAKCDSVVVRWGSSYPIVLEFERTDDDGDTVYDGEMMIAPRIKDAGTDEVSD